MYINLVTLLISISVIFCAQQNNARYTSNYNDSEKLINVSSNIIHAGLSEKLNQQYTITPDFLIENGIAPFTTYYMIQESKEYSANIEILESYIIENINSKFPAAEIRNDICYATTNRQEAVKQIAGNCDYFLVIGASNSSNSLRLVEVAKNYGAKKSILVEDVESLNLNIFENTNNIGVTASASSPEILVKKLLDKLKNNFDIKINEAHYKKEDVYFKVPQKLKN